MSTQVVFYFCRGVTVADITYRVVGGTAEAEEIIGHGLNRRARDKINRSTSNSHCILQIWIQRTEVKEYTEEVMECILMSLWGGGGRAP